MSASRRLNVDSAIAGGVILLVVVALVVLASVVRVASASIAPATVAVEGAPREVQADRLGTIAEIHAENGDVVEAGDLLVSLDATEAEAAVSSLTSRLAAALVRSARLEAQSTGATSFLVPAEAASLVSPEEAATLQAAELRLLSASASHTGATVQQIQSQMRQLELQASGIRQTIAGIDSTITALDTEIAAADASEVAGMHVERSSLEAQRQSAQQQLPQVAEAITERRAQVEVARRAVELDSLLQLDQTRDLIAETRHQLRMAELDLEATAIRAPAAGVVLDSIANTTGEVVQPSQTLMLIVPEDERLLLDARLAAPFVDAVDEGDTVRVRFSTLDSPSTPELSGEVERIAPSTTQDPTTGEVFYAVRIVIDSADLDRLSAAVSVGMPAEALIDGADRSILEYLVRPLVDQMARVFIET